MWKKWVGFAFGLCIVTLLGGVLFFTKAMVLFLNSAFLSEVSTLLIVTVIIGGWARGFLLFNNQPAEKTTVWIYGLSVLVGIGGHLYTSIVGLDQILTAKVILESLFAGVFIWGVPIAGGISLIRGPFQKEVA